MPDMPGAWAGAGGGKNAGSCRIASPPRASLASWFMRTAPVPADGPWPPPLFRLTRAILAVQGPPALFRVPGGPAGLRRGRLRQNIYI